MDTSTEFDLIIVGDEPAGLWLLEEYAARMTDVAGAFGPTAYLSLRGEKRPVALSAHDAAQFKITLPSTWTPEVVAPKRNLTWNSKEIERQFPGAATAQKNLARFPELLTLSMSLWSALGRSRSTMHSTESLVAMTKLLMDRPEYGWWSPSLNLSSRHSVSALSLTGSKVEAIRSTKNGRTAVTFRGIGEVVSRYWVWNLEIRELLSLFSDFPKGLHWINPVFSSAKQTWTRYPVRLSTPNGIIPAVLGDLTLMVEYEEVPFPDWDFVSLILSRSPEAAQLEAWFTARSEASLEDLGAQTRRAVGELFRAFPYLAESVTSIEGCMNTSECLQEQTPGNLQEWLATNSIELYENTLSSARARHSGFACLTPNVGCHLPYPLGTLSAAQDLLKEWIPKKRQVERAATAS